MLPDLNKIMITYLYLNSVDVSGNSVTVSSNIEKAEVLGKFFSSVFTVEAQSSSFLLVKPCHSPIIDSWSLMNKLF